MWKWIFLKIKKVVSVRMDHAIDNIIYCNDKSLLSKTELYAYLIEQCCRVRMVKLLCRHLLRIKRNRWRRQRRRQPAAIDGWSLGTLDDGLLLVTVLAVMMAPGVLCGGRLSGGGDGSDLTRFTVVTDVDYVGRVDRLRRRSALSVAGRLTAVARTGRRGFHRLAARQTATHRRPQVADVTAVGVLRRLLLLMLTAIRRVRFGVHFHHHTRRHQVVCFEKTTFVQENVFSAFVIRNACFLFFTNTRW